MKMIRKPPAAAPAPEVKAPPPPVEPPKDNSAAIERMANATQEALAQLLITNRELVEKLRQPLEPKATSFRCTNIERDKDGSLKGFDIEVKG